MDDVAEVTYKHLITAHVQKLREKRASEGSIRNAESALQRFMKAARRSSSSRLGNEWEDEQLFQSILDRCVRGRPSSSKRSFRSLLCAWRETALAIITAANASENDFFTILRTALYWYQDKYRLSTSELGRRCSINRGSLANFMSGKTLLADTSFKLPLGELEKVLELPKHRLVRAKEYHSSPTKPSFHIPHRALAFELSGKPYFLRTPPPLYPIHEEFIALRHFKTADVTPAGMSRNSRWVTRAVSDSQERSPSWAESLDATRICPSARLVWRHIAAFLGWASLSKAEGGKEIPIEHLSLAYVTDLQLIREYFEFHKSRREGDFSRIFVDFLQVTVSLLQAKTGYIYQHSCFASRLRTPIDPAEWGTWCDGARKGIKQIIGDLKQITRKLRDPSEPIQRILSRQHPLSAIAEMLANMSREIPLYKHRAALHKRNYAIISLLCVVPLRVRNLAALTYRDDGSGHLRRTPEGWRIEIKGKEFKNHRHAARTDFSIFLPNQLSEVLAEYVEKWRPKLLERSEGGERDILFPQQNGRKYPSTHLSNLIRTLTGKYCPDTPGFSPHAFRHIVATEYLKNNPNGYQVVAYILHDRLDTVLHEYGHVTTSDGFAHWTNYLENSALMSEGKDMKPEK